MDSDNDKEILIMKILIIIMPRLQKGCFSGGRSGTISEEHCFATLKNNNITFIYIYILSIL